MCEIHYHNLLDGYWWLQHLICIPENEVEKKKMSHGTCVMIVFNEHFLTSHWLKCGPHGHISTEMESWKSCRYNRKSCEVSATVYQPHGYMVFQNNRLREIGKNHLYHVNTLSWAIRVKHSTFSRNFWGTKECTSFIILFSFLFISFYEII